MALPANPLDTFKNYTCHYELHASNVWEELAALDGTDQNLATTRTESTGTLLINTRRDAHQVIDNVRYGFVAPMGNPTGTNAPAGNLTLDIIEPAGMYFPQKLRNHNLKYKTTSTPLDMHFVLKIIFIGEMGTQPLYAHLVPIQFADMNADFTYKGGTYHLKFIPTVGSLTVTPMVRNPFAFHMAYVNNTIHIKGRTIGDALRDLESKLNLNYEQTYETTVDNSTNARRLRYEINVDREIDGKLSLSTKNSTAEGDFQQMSFPVDETISMMIKKILGSSREYNAQLAANRSKLNTQDERTVRHFTITSRYLLTDTEALLIYDVQVYRGDADDSLKYEFDYYFSRPGANVDVMDFQVKYPTFIPWFASTDEGSDKNVNISGNLPTHDPQYYAKNVVHEDVTKPSIVDTANPRVGIPASSGGVAPLPQVLVSENTGYIKHDVTAVNATRLAFDTAARWMVAATPQHIFTIRGHLGILNDCTFYPDGSGKNGSNGQPQGFGITDSMRVRVNIFTPTEDTQNVVVPIYFTGYYRVFMIENMFTGGRFTQRLSVLMPIDASLVGQSAPNVVTGDVKAEAKAANASTGDGNVQIIDMSLG